MHQSVLYHEALTALSIQPNGIYIDGTFGRGGHSKGILQQLGAEGHLLALDQDQAAIAYAAEEAAFADSRFQLHHANFSDIQGIVEQESLLGQINGILLDLGVSSPQLDNAERGFSFQHDGPLDMRMDQSQGQSVADYLLSVKEEHLAQVIRTYGEERFAKRVARAICQARQEQVITTTKQLANIVAKAIPKWEKHKHPATRTFQALRIEVNQELHVLEEVLPQCLEVLAPGGRLVVIAFHSLEDRLMKAFIRKQTVGDLPAKIPLTEQQLPNRIRAIGKAVRPSAEEIANNPRARSAMMRVLEKIK